MISLSDQTYKDFDVVISNANLNYKDQIDRYVATFSNRLNISVRHDGNDEYAFRRFTVGKDLAESGTDAVMFIDDDVTFGPDYVERCINAYEPECYASWYTWKFLDNGSDYYKKRKKVFDNKDKIHYCGTGVSIIDASVFLNKDLFDKPEEALLVEDLWLSYFVQSKLGWKLKHIDNPSVRLGGGDSVALFRNIINQKNNGSLSSDKADFLRMLVNQYKWKLN